MVLLSLLSMMVVWLLLLLLLLPPLYVLLPLLLRSILFLMTSNSVACSIYHPASVISASATVDPVGEGPPLHSDTSSSYPLPGSIFHAALIPPFAATPTLPFDAAVDTYGK